MVATEKLNIKSLLLTTHQGHFVAQLHKVKHRRSPAPFSKIFNNRRVFKSFNPTSPLLVEKLFLPYVLAFSIFLILHVRHFAIFIRSVFAKIYPHFQFLLLFLLS